VIDHHGGAGIIHETRETEPEDATLKHTKVRLRRVMRTNVMRSDSGIGIAGRDCGSLAQRRTTPWRASQAWAGALAVAGERDGKRREGGCS
jgi:hypothetical protein